MGVNVSNFNLGRFPFYSLICFVLLLGGMVRANDLTLQAGLVYYPDPELDSVVLVEFPFTVNRDEFEFYQPDSADSRLFARIFAEVKLMNTAGIVIDSTKTYFSSAASSADDAVRTGLKLFDNLALLIAPGEYTARLTVIDAVSKRKGEAFYDKLTVEPAFGNNLCLGGPLLAYKIKYVGVEEQPNPRLVHNGLLVHTNPLGVFSTVDSQVYLYAELYNISGSVSDAPLKIEYRLESEHGRVVTDWGFKLQSRASKSIVITESLDIVPVLAGNYQLRLVVTDSLFDQTIVKRVPLLVLEPSDFNAEAVARKSEGDPYDTLVFQHKLNIARYELNPEEKMILDRLSDEGKLNYLDQFWKEHDDQPLTVSNERRNEIIKRYAHANQEYSTDFEKTDGWSTDRGRIYLVHGEPDRIQSNLMPTASSPDVSMIYTGSPYEVWYYFQIEEGKEVVFVDEDGFGEYKLEHSNFDGEQYSEYWYSVLRSAVLDVDH